MTKDLNPADVDNFVQLTAHLIVADVRAGKVAAEALTPQVVRGYVVEAYARHTRMVDRVADRTAALSQRDPMWRAISGHLYAALRAGEVTA